MLEYRAEGLCRNANHLSREELSRCMASGEVLQSTALAYDTGHRLRFELGGLRGIMPFADCVDAAPGETVKDIAALESKDADLQRQITSNDTDISAIQAKDREQDARLDAIETVNDAQAASITQNTQNIARNTQNIQDNAAQIAVVENFLLNS